MNKYLKAFTIAETLIVIMIIGVIAAITIPTIGSKVDRNKGLFKKAYSLTERSVAELVNDETYYPYDFKNFGFAETTDMKIIGTDMYTSTVDYSNSPKEPDKSFKNPLVKFCNLYASTVNTAGNPVFDNKTEPNDVKECSFATGDGVEWKITRPVATGKEFLIAIDVNGKDKIPNLPASVSDVSKDKDGNAKNRDNFYIYVKFDGKMYIPDEDEVAKDFLKSSNINKEEKTEIKQQEKIKQNKVKQKQ